MRCLALAQAWQEAGGRAVFAMAEKVTAIESRLAAEKMPIFEISAPVASDADAHATAALAATHGASWIVVDGYRFDHPFLAKLRADGRPVLVLDDDGRSSGSDADVILNQNAFASRRAYSTARPETALLLGSRYTMLRREFLQLAARRTTAPTASRVLVTFGAADPANTTGTVVVGLAALADPELEVVVILGPANPHRATIEATVRAAGPRFRLVEHAADLSSWMAWADLAIAAAGSTCWELAFLQVPQLVVPIAENQRPVARVLAERGAAIDLGWYEELHSAAVAQAVEALRYDLDRRKTMQHAGRAFIDGAGAQRVVLELRSRQITLRPVEPADRRWIWELANDPAARAMSFSTEPIPWDSHCAWMDRRLADPNCRFFIATNEADEPLGQVRFELAETGAVISTSLVAGQRGRGYGSALILAACRQLFHETKVATVHAYIKPENAASVNAFAKASFSATDDAVVSGHRALHFTLHRTDLPEYADL